MAVVRDLVALAEAVAAVPEDVAPPGVDLDLVLAGGLVPQQDPVLVLNPVISPAFTPVRHANPLQ